MALIEYRNWDDPGTNRRVRVFYDAGLPRAITRTIEPIDPAQPVYNSGSLPPLDNIPDGTELARFCEGSDLVVLTATDAHPLSSPFIQIAVTVNSPECDGSTLAIVRITGFAPISPATTGKAEVQVSGGVSPYSVTINGTTVVADGSGLGTITGLPPGSYGVTVEDDLGTMRYGTVVIPAAVIAGCTLPGALNYDPSATDNDGSCEFVAIDAQPGGLVAAHLPVLLLMRAAPIGAQPAGVSLYIETATTSAGPWTLVGELRQTADPVTAMLSFNASEACKALFRSIVPPVESGLDAGLSRLVRLRYIVRSSAGVDSFAGTLTPFRVLNAAVQPPVDGVLSFPTYASIPAGSAVWSNTATLDAVSADDADVPVNGADWPCPLRQFVWLNRLGGWDTGFFMGRHQHGTDQADGIAYRDLQGADRYASRGTVRPTLQVYSDKLDFPTYQSIRGIRDSIQVYERTGVNAYVPVLVAAGSYAEFQEQTDKTFEVNFTISYPPVLIQTQ